MRQSDRCEIHILNDLIGASNIPLSIREHRCYLFVFFLLFFFLITQQKGSISSKEKYDNVSTRDTVVTSKSLLEMEE